MPNGWGDHCGDRRSLPLLKIKVYVTSIKIVVYRVLGVGAYCNVEKKHRRTLLWKALLVHWGLLWCPEETSRGLLMKAYSTSGFYGNDQKEILGSLLGRCCLIINSDFMSVWHLFCLLIVLDFGRMLSLSKFFLYFLEDIEKDRSSPGKSCERPLLRFVLRGSWRRLQLRLVVRGSWERS